MRKNIKYAVLMIIALGAGAKSLYAQEKPLKIICYNILYGMRTDSTEGKQVFAEWVRQQDPDILALQEANYFTQKTLEELAHSFGHPYAIQSKETGFPTAITSKTPIVNTDIVLANMWHGFVKCKVNGYNIIVLHFSPHQYMKKREEIEVVLETVRQSGPFEKWIIMGDFNSLSPLDREKYADNVYRDRLAESERKSNNRHLHNGELDYYVHQSILDFGFVDTMREDKENFSLGKFNSRIDFIYVSPDLKEKIISADYITDEFTKIYSDHRPIYVTLKNE